MVVITFMGDTPFNSKSGKLVKKISKTFNFMNSWQRSGFI